MIVFNASEEQLYRLFQIAVSASYAVGNDYDPSCEFTPEEFKNAQSQDGKKISVDHFKGRRVKLNVRRLEGTEDDWKRDPSLMDYPDPSYQTFTDKFATYEDLLEAAGITDWKYIADEEEYVWND